MTHADIPKSEQTLPVTVEGPDGLNRFMVTFPHYPTGWHTRALHAEMVHALIDAHLATLPPKEPKEDLAYLEFPRGDRAPLVRNPQSPTQWFVVWAAVPPSSRPQRDYMTTPTYGTWEHWLKKGEDDGYRVVLA